MKDLTFDCSQFLCITLCKESRMLFTFCCCGSLFTLSMKLLIAEIIFSELQQDGQYEAMSCFSIQTHSAAKKKKMIGASLRQILPEIYSQTECEVQVFLLL